MKNKRQLLFFLQEIYLTGKDKCRFKVKGWEKVLQEIGTQKQPAGGAYISDKTDFN
jgi:hypothetical protein